MDQVDEGLAAFVPTDGDVESLAVYLYACMYESSFAGGKGRLWDSLPSEISYSWRRVARHAFDHAGYLPSIAAACKDTQSDMRRARSDVWVATGPDTALPIDSITRLIEIAHETKDPELRKLATIAAAVLLHPHCPMASA